MKKGIVVAALLCAGVVGMNAGSANAGQSASTSTVVAWPDYHAKPWVPAMWEKGEKTVDHPAKGNDYITKYAVLIGGTSVYADSENPETAKTVVAEVDILNNGPVIRQMSVIVSGMLVPVDFQIKLKDKWTSAPKGSRVSYVILDEDAVLTKNTLKGVTVTIKDPDGKVFAVLNLENKKKKK